MAALPLPLPAARHPLPLPVVAAGAVLRSEANVADMPSRDDFAFLHERLHRLIPGSAKAVRRDVVLPPIDSWRSIEEALAFGLDARKRA